MATAEKRRHRRVRAKGIVAYLWIDGQMTSAIIENISPGGLFFRTAQPAPPGAEVTTRLVVQGSKKAIELTGSVVNSVAPALALSKGLTPGMGIEFASIPAESQARFDKLLKNLGLPPVTRKHLSPTPQTQMDIDRALSISEAGAEPTGAGPGMSYSYRVYDSKVTLDPQPPATPLQATRPQPGPPKPSQPQVAPVESQTGKSQRKQHTTLPEPIMFELQVPKKATKANPNDNRQLLAHVDSLMKQLAAAEEIIRFKDQQILILEKRVRDLIQQG